MLVGQSVQWTMSIHLSVSPEFAICYLLSFTSQLIVTAPCIWLVSRIWACLYWSSIKSIWSSKKLRHWTTWSSGKNPICYTLVWESLGKSGKVWTSLGKSGQVWVYRKVRAYIKVRASPGIQESPGKSETMMIKLWSRLENLTYRWPTWPCLSFRRRV